MDILQLPFLTKGKGKNDRRNNFMINLPESMGGGGGIGGWESHGSAVRHTTDWVVEPGSLLIFL